MFRHTELYYYPATTEMVDYKIFDRLYLRLSIMLRLCFFCKSQPWYAYKRYAYKKRVAEDCARLGFRKRNNYKIQNTQL